MRCKYCKIPTLSEMCKSCRKFYKEEKEKINMIKINKRYVTRKGNPVRLLTTNGMNKTYPVVGEVNLPDEGWVVQSWTLSGNVYDNKKFESGFDLFEEPQEFWKIYNVASGEWTSFMSQKPSTKVQKIPEGATHVNSLGVFYRKEN